MMRFFEAKDVVQREASKPKSIFAKSDTAQAFEIVMNAKRLDDAEKELNQWMVLSGHADLWQQLLIERNNIQQRRKKQEILDEKHAAEKKKEMDELINWLLGGGIVVMVLGFIVWWLTLLMEKH
jgi:hypothetical protein